MSSNCPIFQEITETKKFKICFYFKIGENENINVIEYDYFDIEKKHIYELLENLVKKINEKKISINYKDREYDLSLQESEEKNFYAENYEIRLSKNNLSPKYDLPPFSSDINLKNMLNEKLCFIPKNQVNILLREKENENIELIEKEEDKCNSLKNICLIW